MAVYKIDGAVWFCSKGNSRHRLERGVQLLNCFNQRFFCSLAVIHFLLQCGMRLRQLAALLVKAVKGAHLQYQYIGIEWFGEIIDATGFKTFCYELFVCVDCRKKN